MRTSTAHLAFRPTFHPVLAWPLRGRGSLPLRALLRHLLFPLSVSTTSPYSSSVTLTFGRQIVVLIAVRSARPEVAGKTSIGDILSGKPLCCDRTSQVVLSGRRGAIARSRAKGSVTAEAHVARVRFVARVPSTSNPNPRPSLVPRVSRATPSRPVQDVAGETLRPLCGHPSWRQPLVIAPAERSLNPPPRSRSSTRSS